MKVSCLLDLESLYMLVQVWRLDSSDPEYSLLGHLKKVTCLDFVTCGDQQYLISGSYDSTVKVDLPLSSNTTLAN